ncbi:MAG: iron-sulfur cluster assembly protein [Patescibacteria group bacterium]
MDAEATRQRIIGILKTCYDPEIPVNVYDLGLVYQININELGDTEVQMTLTAPNCPVAGSLPEEIENRILMGVPDLVSVKVTLVWDPPWNSSMMSEAARLQLGL